MSGDVSIDLGSALPYLSEKFLGWLGKDSATKEAIAWFNELQRSAHLEASTVQCIGMHTPVPIGDIYQPTRLITGEILPFEQFRAPYKPVDATEFLKTIASAIIKAGPGYGKTTFLHHVYITQLKNPNLLPILIPLRKSTALADLQTLIDLATTVSTKKWKENRRILLLVDGYDEITVRKQKAVSELLIKFEALTLGVFFLTCRKFYDVYDLKTRVISIAPFAEIDQIAFANSFLRLYGVDLNAETMITELKARQMQEFLAHPLLLALVCIIKSNPDNPLGNSVLELAATAVDTLSFRWDLAKGVARHATTRLSGKNRIDLLSWLAFKIVTSPISATQVRRLAEEYLKKLRWTNLQPIQVLRETAQFYGIFVPYDTGWTFVHKVVHDFLAARYWVSTGSFNPRLVKTWNTRAAYAACLQADATDSMLLALEDQQFPSFAEMLMNSPPFDDERVATKYLESLNARRKPDAAVHLSEDDVDYLRYGSPKFLDALVAAAITDSSPLSEPIIQYALLELAWKQARLAIPTYRKCVKRFGKDFIFQDIHRGRWQSMTLGRVAPPNIAG